jgi:hypothetical protein
MAKKQMITLNDFSGGLNTKFSPRDISPQELKKADNVIVSKPGLLQSSSDSTAVLGTANSPSGDQITAGYGAFLFNSQWNTDSSATPGDSVQVFAFPEDASSGNTKILTYARAFGNTGNFTLTEDSGDASIDMQTTGLVKPVYYFVDGVLYVSDENVVNESTFAIPRKLQYIKTSRFVGEKPITAWVDEESSVAVTEDVFEAIETNTDGAFTGSPSAAGEFRLQTNPFPEYQSSELTEIKDPNDSGINIITTTNPSASVTDPEVDIGIDDKLIYLKAASGTNDINAALNNIDLIFIENECMRVIDVTYLTTDESGSAIRILQVLVERNVGGTGATPEHGSDNVVKKQDNMDIVLTGGGWDSGTYEFTHSFLDINNNESLLQAPNSTTCDIAGSAFFHRTGFKMYMFNTRKSEKGIRIYTRKKGSNDRWILFLDVDYERGVRTNLFEEYTQFTISGNFASVTNLNIINPGLDTYESINGWSQEEKSLTFGESTKAVMSDGNVNELNGAISANDTTTFNVNDGSNFAVGNYIKVSTEVVKITNISTNALTVTRGQAGTSALSSISDNEDIYHITFGGYKAATISARRAWVANVKKNDKMFDDRIYYSPVNNFSTFPDTFYLDIGLNDGDAFTALHSLGNRLLAFKEKKLYVINVESSSDAGWYLEAEYNGMGCVFQESVIKTPFGVCWVNRNGVFIFDGQSSPKELTMKLDDDLWDKGQLSYYPSIGYNPKYKQLNVLQDSAVTSNSDVTTEDRLFIYDFMTQSWTTSDSIGTADVSNFVTANDAMYFWKHSDNKIHKVTGDMGTKLLNIITKDIDFGKPGLQKKIHKIFITCRDNAEDTDLALKYYTNGKSSSVTRTLSAQQINSADYKVLIFTPNSDDMPCQSIALELLASDGGGTSGSKIEINDITIEYKILNRRVS